MAFPTITVDGLTITEVATTELAAANDTQLHRFADGRFTLGKTDTVGLYSTNAVDWSEGAVGPAQGGYKCAVELGNNETLNIYRTTVGEAGASYTFQRSLNDWVDVVTDEGAVDTPRAVPLSGDAGETESGMLFHHGALVNRSTGDLIATMYGNYDGDTRLADGYPPVWNFRKYRTIVVSSANKGLNWGDPQTVAYDMMLTRGTNPDVEVVTYAQSPALTQEGFCEADLTYAPNGDLLCFMRSGGRNSFDEAWVLATPLYMARSLNHGVNWETPVYVADRGANPCATTLASGVIVVIYSNPGTWLMFSDDHGHEWKGHTQISTSSAYGDIAEYDEDTCLITYYDDGIVHATKLRVVQTGEPVPARVDLLANPHRIASGQSSTLTWFTDNGNQGLLNGGPWTNQSVGASSVSSTGALTETTTFTIRFNSVSDPGTFTQRSVTVHVE